MRLWNKCSTLSLWTRFRTLSTPAWGFVLIMRREYDQTIDHYRKCLELDPSYYHFYTGLGRAYAQKGMLAKALEHFLKGKELSGHLPYITGIIAYCHAMMGRFSRAEKLLA